MLVRSRIYPLTIFLQENESILGEQPRVMESEAGDHDEEPVENPLAQSLHDELPILAAPQIATKQTPLGDYLVAHADALAQAERRWKDASVDEWKAGAQGKFSSGTNHTIT